MRFPSSRPSRCIRARSMGTVCGLRRSAGTTALTTSSIPTLTSASTGSPRKTPLILSRMAPDGSRLLDEGALVYDGHAQVDPPAQESTNDHNRPVSHKPDDPTVEGPKLYKR